MSLPQLSKMACKFLVRVIIALIFLRNQAVSSFSDNFIPGLNPEGNITSSSEYRNVDDKNFTKCLYLIQSPGDMHLRLNFTTFGLKGNSSCSTNRMEVYNGETTQITPLTILCGSTGESIVTPSAKTVLIQVFSVLARSSFSAYVFHRKEPCKTCTSNSTVDHYHGDCPPETPIESNPSPLSVVMECLPLGVEGGNSVEGGNFVEGGNSDMMTHYWIISSCPVTANTEVVRKCHGHDDVDNQNRYPVFSKSSGLPFKNKFCALCNGVRDEDVDEVPLTSTCKQCPPNYELKPGDAIEIAYWPDCYIFAEGVSIDGCALLVLSSDAVLPQRRPVSNLTVIFDNFDTLLIRDEQDTRGRPCLLDQEMFINGECVSIFSNLMNKTSYFVIILTVDEQFNCTYLDERAEKCFTETFRQFYSDSETNHRLPLSHDLGSARSEANFGEVPWKRVVDPLWSTPTDSGQIFLEISQNYLGNETWKQQLVGTVDYIFFRENSEWNHTQGCYLRSLELFEATGNKDITLPCHDRYVETTVYKPNETKNDLIDQVYEDQDGVVWKSSSTIFKRDISERYQRTVVVCKSEEEDAVLIILVNISCAVAVVCFGLVIFVYLFLTSLRNTFGLLMMSFLTSFILGIILLQFVGPYVTEIPPLCESVAVLSHWVWVSVFAWMSVIAFDMRQTFNVHNVRVASRNMVRRKRFMKYAAFAWGLPTVTVTTCVLLWRLKLVEIYYGSRNETQPCWIFGDLAAFIAVSGPLLFCLFINLIFFILIVRGILSHRASSRLANVEVNPGSQEQGAVTDIIIFTKISLLMGFTWLFGYLIPLTRIKSLQYIFYILFLMQGFLIFISFGMNRRVRTYLLKQIATNSSVMYLWANSGSRTRTTPAH